MRPQHRNLAGRSVAFPNTFLPAAAAADTGASRVLVQRVRFNSYKFAGPTTGA